VFYLSVTNPAARIEEPRTFWEVVRVDETRLPKTAIQNFMSRPTREAQVEVPQMRLEAAWYCVRPQSNHEHIARAPSHTDFAEVKELNYELSQGGR
jgi:hypothetical protein